MSPAARSLQAFAFYLGAVAATLLLAPNVLLDAFGVPRTTEVWIRVAGMVVGFLALYDWVAARTEAVAIHSAFRADAPRGPAFLPGVRHRGLGALAAAAVRSGGPRLGAVDVAAARQKPGTVIAREARTR
jgi:hypothetical protein